MRQLPDWERTGTGSTQIHASTSVPWTQIHASTSAPGAQIYASTSFCKVIADGNNSDLCVNFSTWTQIHASTSQLETVRSVIYSDLCVNFGTRGSDLCVNFPTGNELERVLLRFMRQLPGWERSGV